MVEMPIIASRSWRPGENGFKAQAVSVVDFDKDGVFNVWEIDQDKNLEGDCEGLMRC